MDSLEDEFVEPYQTWKKQNTPESTGNLLRAVDPVLKSAVTTYAGTNASPTMMGHAKRLALDAFPNYNPSQGKLKNFLMQNLQGLRRLHHQGRQPIKIPEQVMLERKYLQESENKLRDDLGRDPSSLELADATGLSPHRQKYVLGINHGVSSGSYLQMSKPGEDPYEPAVQEDDKHWIDFVYYGLHPSDQVILEHSLGLHGKKILDNQALAKKLGITASAVSQRRNRIQDQLNQRKNLGVF